MIWTTGGFCRTTRFAGLLVCLRYLRKWIPGTAGGTVRRQVRTVYFATSSGFAGGASSPVALQGKVVVHICYTTFS
jgi:hypothetical protein